MVGLLVLVGAAGFVMMFGSLDKGIDEKGAYEVNTLFADATGLVENSRVMLSGIPVGAITHPLHGSNGGRAFLYSCRWCAVALSCDRDIEQFPGSALVCARARPGR